MNELAKALVAAQKKIGSAQKDSQNPHFKNKYASLESVWEACHSALNDQGIAVSQAIQSNEGQFYLKTILIHSSGQTLESNCPLLMVRNDMQALGSAITYARRYGLAAAVGVIQSDDDGEDAVDGSKSTSYPSLEFISEKQWARAQWIAKEHKYKGSIEEILKKYGASKPSELKKSVYEQFCNELAGISPK